MAINSPLIAARFWSKVSVADSQDDCWLWNGGLDSDGYGLFFVGRKSDGSTITYGAHRVAYILMFGAINPGAQILHACDVRRCVNPAHLFAGNHAMNMQDRAVKGGYVGRPSRLSVEQQQLATRLLENGCPLTEIARRLGETRAVVRSFARSRHLASRRLLVKKSPQGVTRRAAIAGEIA